MVGKPRADHLLAAQIAVLRHMDIRGDDVCSITMKEIYATAHLAKSTFEQNFVNLDDVLKATKQQIIEGLETALSLVSKEPLSMKQGLFLAFRWLYVPERRTPVELAVRRFNIDFWKTALVPIKRIMERAFDRYAPATVQWKYEEFCAMFLQVLRAWLKEEMKSSLLEEYLNYLLYTVSTLNDKYIEYMDEYGKQRTIYNQLNAEFYLNRIEEKT